MNTLITRIPTFAVEDIEQPEKLFAVGILDVFNRVLSEEEIEYLITYRPNSLFSRKKELPFYTYEQKFLACFKNFLEQQSENSVSIYCQEINSLDSRRIRFIKNNLQNEDKKRLNHFIKNNSEDLIVVSDIEDLLFFARLSTRELLFSNFFFADFVIIGNYNLSFPIYCVDTETLAKCEAISRREGLYIRG